MLRFKILNTVDIATKTNAYVGEFQCSSLELALHLFYEFCCDRLFISDHDEYSLFLLNEDGSLSHMVASYGDFSRHIRNLIKVAGGI